LEVGETTIYPLDTCDNELSKYGVNEIN